MAKAVTRTGKKTLTGHIKSLFNGMGYVLTGQSMETGNIKAHYLAVLQGQEREKPSEELAEKLVRGNIQTIVIAGGIYMMGTLVVSMTAPLLVLHTSVLMAGFFAYMGFKKGGVLKKLEEKLSNIQKKAKRQHDKNLAHHKKRGRELLLTNNF